MTLDAADRLYRNAARQVVTAGLVTISIWLAGAMSAQGMLSAATPESRKGDMLEEIVVTARKREESRQDVPLSVAAISADQLEAQGTRQVSDLTNKLPNFLVQTGTVNSLTSVTVRGIEASVRNAGFQSSVSFYVDGIYQGRPANFNQDLLDIERVELLLGPQGTLFGENTIAGVMNIVTQRPSAKLEGFAAVQAGNYGFTDVRASVNLPLDSRWAMRLSGSVSDRDGYQKNELTGKAQGNLHRGSGRVQLLGKFDATDVLVVADYQKADERPQAPEFTEPATTAGVPNFSGPPFTISQDPDTSRVERKGLAVKVDHRFAQSGTLSSVTSWKKTGSDDAFDQDLGPDPRIRSNIYNNENERLISQEFRYESDQQSALRYTLGAFYLDDRVELNRLFDYPPPLILLGPLGALHFQIPSYSRLESKSYAAFGNLEYDIRPNLIASVGLRYSKDKQDVDWKQNEILLALGGVTSAALAQQILGPGHNGFLIANAPTYTDSREDSSVSGTATLTYKFDDQRLAYLRYARGTKSGGFNLEPLPDPLPPSRAFGPEKLDAYELGLKSQWLDKRLLANIAFFYEDYSDLQRVDVIPVLPAGFTRVIRNAGKVEVKGAEIEVDAVPVSGLTIRASYGYAQAKYKEFRTLSGTDLSGQPLGGVPKWNATLGVNYTHPISGSLALFADASADFRGKRLLGPSDATAVSVDGYEVVDARLGVTTTDGSWEVAAWAKNLTDKLYVTFRTGGNDFFPSGEGVAYGLPRMYGVSVRYNFGAH